MHTRTSLWLLLCSATLTACFPEQPENNAGGGGPPPPARNFSSATFDSQVLPIFRDGGCMGCHDSGVALGGFGLYAMPADDAQRDENAVQASARVGSSVTATTPQSAILYIKATTAHSGSTPLPDALALENWIRAGLGGTPIGGGDGPDGGGGGGGFDPAVFASDVQPIFDDNGCTANGCHSATTGAGGFALNADADAGTPELQANIDEVLTQIDTTLAPADATMANIYVRVTTAHSGSGAVTDPSELEALRSWIATGLMSQ